MKQRSLYRSACALLAALLMLVSAVVTSVPAFAGEKASFTVSYYDYKGAVIRKDTVTAGDTTRPPTPPALEGRKFAHWYVVNDDLKGDLAKKFDFGTAVSRDLNLKTHYEPLAQKSAPASEKQAEAPAEPPRGHPCPGNQNPGHRSTTCTSPCR